jgi:hypothetical protein
MEKHMFLAKHIGIMAAAVLIGAPVAASAESIVVRASGPSARSYTPGKKLADNTSITLKGGDVLTLLDGRGTRTLRGPGTFGSTSDSAAGSDTRTSLASLLATNSGGRARTGAIRGEALVQVAPRSPNLWYVDISQASTMCVADPAAVRLWRPDRAAPATLGIKGKDGAAASVAFGAGDSIALWPANLPVEDGGSYTLSGGGIAQPVTITFSVMGARSEGLEGMASALISRNCQAQLSLLVETVALPDPSPDM